MTSGVTETDRCPFARKPDMTGCDCDCTVPRPKGFWASLKWFFGRPWCITGPGGMGDGRLPCPRYDEWLRQNSPTQADCVAHGLALAAKTGMFKKNGW